MLRYRSARHWQTLIWVTSEMTLGGGISTCNPEYCELTGLYWAWKNLQNIDYIGLAHYRRYFDDSVTKDSIERWLGSDGYDAISIEPPSTWQSNHMNLSYWITAENFHILLDAILRLHPEYHDTINDYLFDSNVYYHCNMFIMKRSRFNAYCEWLFPVLEAYKEKVLPSNYLRVNRSVGYAAEALQGLFFVHNKMKVKHVGLYLAEEDYVPVRRHFYENLGFALSRGLKRVVLQYMNKPLPPRAIPTDYAIMDGLRAQGIVLEALEKHR